MAGASRTTSASTATSGPGAKIGDGEHPAVRRNTRPVPLLFSGAVAASYERAARLGDDLILHDHKFELVEQVHYTLSTHIRVRVEFAGRNTAVFADPRDLVAVRRYVTEEAS